MSAFSRISPLFLYWAAVFVFILCLAIMLVWPDRFAPVASVLVGGYVLFGPTCPHCFHPVFWDRNPTSPNGWSFYRPRVTFNTRCGRCGRDLIEP